MGKGRYGIFGGQYIPETLMNAVEELEEAYARYSQDPEFLEELENLLKNYVPEILQKSAFSAILSREDGCFL